MKRTIATIACTGLLAAGLAAGAHAADRTGQIAIGFNTTDAPVGLRYFVSPNVGIDVGLGFESKDLGGTSASSFWAEFGLPYVVAERGQAFFFVRPALGFASLDDRVYGTGGVDDTWSVLTLEANLGAEVHLADNFGLTFQHGLRLTNSSLPDGVTMNGEDSLSDFETFGENVTEAGVWFTF